MPLDSGFNLYSTQKEALLAGAKNYFTGRPCGRGHISERYAMRGDCVQCNKEYKAKKYLSNVEEQRKIRLEWRIKNAERHRANARKYWNNNLEKARAVKRRNYQLNKERIKADTKKVRELNPERYAAYGRKRRALKLNAGGKHTAEDIRVLFRKQKGKCAVCFKSLKITGQHIDHIMPLSRGGSNGPENLQLLCPRDNSSKQALDNIEYAKRIGRLL